MQKEMIQKLNELITDNKNNSIRLSALWSFAVNCENYGIIDEISLNALVLDIKYYMRQNQRKIDQTTGQ